MTRLLNNRVQTTVSLFLQMENHVLISVGMAEKAVAKTRKSGDTVRQRYVYNIAAILFCDVKNLSLTIDTHFLYLVRYML